MTRSTSISTPLCPPPARTATARSSKRTRTPRIRVELPAKPLRRRIHIHCGQCRQCGRRLRAGRHPLQTGDATGAAASQASVPRPRPTWSFTSTSTPDCPTARRPTSSTRLEHPADARGQAPRSWCGPAADYGRFIAGNPPGPLPDEKHLTPDETGWRLGGRLVWLPRLESGARINLLRHRPPTRRRSPLGRVIGFDWSGDMTHDGAAAYDRFLMARHQQCVFHVLHRAPRPGASPGRPGQGVSASGHHPVPGGAGGCATRRFLAGEYSTRPGCKQHFDRYVEGCSSPCRSSRR